MIIHLRKKFIALFILLTALSMISTFNCKSGDKKDLIVKIGVALPMNYESYGKAPLNGIKLALNEMNYEIKGKKVELITRDTQNDPKRGADIINEFASMGLQVILGAAASNLSVVMAPVANRYKIVMLSPISSASELTGAGGPFFFRSVPSDPAQSEIIANWILKSNPKKVGILFVDNSWGRGLANAAQRFLEQEGVEIVRQKVVSDKVADYSTQITALKLAGIDALFIPLYPYGAGLAVKQCKDDFKLDVPIFGADSWGSQEFLTGAGEYSEGAMFVIPGIYSGEKYNSFVARYEETYGKEPNFNAASSYDCMYILAKVISSIIESREKFSGENILKKLHQVDFDGVTGKTKFDENGDVIGKAYTKKIIRNGKFDFLLEK